MEIVFWLSIALLLYTYAGYPLLVAALARWQPRPVARAPRTPPVTIILVVRDGEQWIERKLGNCLTLDYPHDLLDVVLVSDGSTDRTVERARRLESPRIEIVVRDEPRGKAACLNDAVAHAGGDILLFTDVRQRLDAQAVNNLVAGFADDSVGAVSGELVFDSAAGVGRDFSGQNFSGQNFSGGMNFYWQYEKWIRDNEARFASSVGVTGAIYALRRELYEPLPARTVLDDVLIPMRVVQGGRRVIFERRALAFDIPSASRRREQRRKVRTIAGNCQLVQIRPDLLFPWRNPVWWQFVSHKLLRLAVPLFLLLALASNVALALESMGYRVLLAAQIALYLVALAGIWLPAAQGMRWARVPAAFLLLNWFAVLGIFSFARHGGEQPW